MKKYTRIVVRTEIVTITRVRVEAVFNKDKGTGRHVVLNETRADPQLAARHGLQAAERAAEGHELIHGYKPPIEILGKELNVVA